MTMEKTKMEDKKKLTNEEIKSEELTDEQANDAAGGKVSLRFNYTCPGCSKVFSGFVHFIEDTGYCEECYQNIKFPKQI